MLFKILALAHLCAAFPLKCPEPAQWTFRANGHCTDPSKYFCLKNDLINGYSENCTRSDFQQPGRKAVLRGGIDAEICSVERYQPFPIRFYTNASTNCIFFKSFCNEEGQVVYNKGNRNTDVTCRCDYRRGYKFSVTPVNACFCKPLQDDCSCYLEACSNSSHILSSDYQCIYKTDHAQVTQCRPIKDDSGSNGGRTEIAVNYPDEDEVFSLVPWRKRSAIVLLPIVGCTCVVLLVLFIRRLWGYCFREMFTCEFNPVYCIEGETLQLKCSVRSKNIKVEWFKGEQKIEEKDNISIQRAGSHHCLIIEYAKPTDTGQYVIIAGNVRKQLTVTVIALIPEAINRLPEEDINRYVKLMQSSETEKRYFVRIMIVGKGSVGKTCLLRRILKESIDDVSSTDGVDIVVRRCKINIDSGNWTIDKETYDDRTDRIFRALRNDKPVQNKSIKKDISDEKLQTETKSRNSIENATSFSKFETNALLVDKIIAEVPDKRNIGVVENASINDTTDDNSTFVSVSVSNVKVNRNENIHVTNNDNEENVSLEMPSDLMSCVFSTTSTTNDPSNHYALCGLWDFAGQKEFYATHQAFLTNSAIYLVVADMADDISTQKVQQSFADFQHVGGYVDFWFDTIHCHRTVEPPVNKLLNDHIDPPVILVLTGKDIYEKEQNAENRKLELQTQLDLVLGEKSKYHHLRKIFWLSNKTDPDTEFEKLRQKISTIAMQMKNWGQQMPLKWILLEHLIEINKNAGMNFINLSDMLNLSKHPDVDIHDIEEVLLFLRFQHEEGNIIFFGDIQDFIILNPKWLVDAFRCLVSDRIDDRLQHREDWSHFLRNGFISESLITELFRSKCGNQFSEQKNNLIKVMEKFDILVEIPEKGSYIMPSMMQSLSFDEVCNRIGVDRENCKRTSWLCLKFSFLPPAFFNHLSVWLIKNYKTSRIRNEKQSLALFRGVCLFDIDESGCEKILVTISTDTIALQLLSFSTEEKEFGVICNRLRKDLTKKTDAIKKRYNLAIDYSLHFKCSRGNYYEDTKSYQDLVKSTEYYCNEHLKTHQSETTYLPWIMNEDEDISKIKNEKEQKNIENHIPLRCQYCKKKPVIRCYECCNVLCYDCFQKHNEITNSEYHMCQSTRDKMLLNNKFEFSKEIVEMKNFPGGILVIAFRFSKMLLVFYFNRERQIKKEIGVGGIPCGMAKTNFYNVAVLLTHNYKKIDSLEIVDIRKREVIKHIDMPLIDVHLPFVICPLVYIADQFYVTCYHGITVTDMSGEIVRNIQLSFTPAYICWSTEKNFIYCLDSLSKTLLLLNTDGKIENWIRKGFNPRCLAYDNERYLYILYHSKQSFKNFMIEKVRYIPGIHVIGEMIHGRYLDKDKYDRCSSICFHDLSGSVVIGLGKTIYVYQQKNVNST